MSNNGGSSGGPNIFLSLLTILFIGLKLTGHIDWSWWWVLSPIWISLLVCLVIFGIMGILYLVDAGRRK